MAVTDETTTEASTERAVHPEHVLGVLWLTPDERFDAFQRRATLGRSESCTLHLEGSQVSRQHASLEKTGPLWLLRDLGGKNGTWVNAQRRDVVALEQQDTLRIGDWVGVVCSVPRASIEAGELFTTLASGLLVSASTRAALGPFESFAQRDLAIAIYGETGTGKEGLAQAIHRHSGRSGRLVALNCAAVPEAMAEGLLFGHRKGAFTGAHESAEGHIRAAHRGTLFLDEIADLPLAVQGKLLRVLEERAVTPLGATEPVAIDFRLIVACQEPLSKLAAEGSFRGDLYARSSGVELTMPPLRARRQEVLRLLSNFLAEEQSPPPFLDSRLIEALCIYDWPYNVRELKQLAVVLGASGKPRLNLSDLPERFQAAPEADETEASPGAPASDASARRLAWLSRHARELNRLRVALEKHEGNVSNAALEAGVPRHRARRLLAAEAERAGVARK